MDENKTPENGNLSRRKHFAKFHERVHNKYVEMQRKLEKSRSVDSLSSLSDNSSFRSSRDSFNSDFRDDEVFEIKSERNLLKYSVIVEDVNKCDALFKDFEGTPVYESVVTPSIETSHHENKNGDTNVFFGDNWNLSLESIFDPCNNKQTYEIEFREAKHDDDVHPTSPRKASLRSRIGERLLAARERRKEARMKKKEKEKVNTLFLSNKLGHLDNAPIDIQTKKKNKIASVAVAVIDATETENESPDKALEDKPRQLLHCRIRLGTEKRKTKMVKSVGSKASWHEMFNIGLYDKYLLELTMWDKDTFIGRCSLDLKSLEEETTHRIQLELEESATKIRIFMLVTISGTLNNLIINSESEDQLVDILDEYVQDIGLLHVNVYQASGLPDNTDKLCVIELVNDRKQTQTEMKTGEPEWSKYFTFQVKDVTSVLSITVFEDKRSELTGTALGKVLIPLLAIENEVKRWYTLKDLNLTTPCKGKNPKILLKMSLYYNPVKAAVRVLAPKEPLLITQTPGFDRHIFASNVSRAKVILTWIYDVKILLNTIFEWDNQVKNILSLIIWVTFWWKFKQWMVPLFLLVPFLLYTKSETLSALCKIFSPICTWVNKFDSVSTLNDNMQDKLGAGEPSRKEKKEETKSLIQRVRSLTEIVTTVQNDIGHFASFGESVKNLVNFSVPFLSLVAIKLILIVTLIMYFIPIGHLLIFWGIWKYLRKLIHPNRVPNNEILDLISRVPDDQLLLNCQELPVVVDDEDLGNN